MFQDVFLKHNKVWMDERDQSNCASVCKSWQPLFCVDWRYYDQGNPCFLAIVTNDIVKIRRLHPNGGNIDFNMHLDKVPRALGRDTILTRIFMACLGEAAKMTNTVLSTFRHSCEVIIHIRYLTSCGWDVSQLAEYKSNIHIRIHNDWNIDITGDAPNRSVHVWQDHSPVSPSIRKWVSGGRLVNVPTQRIYACLGVLLNWPRPLHISDILHPPHATTTSYLPASPSEP